MLRKSLAKSVLKSQRSINQIFTAANAQHGTTHYCDPLHLSVITTEGVLQLLHHLLHILLAIHTIAQHIPLE